VNWSAEATSARSACIPLSAVCSARTMMARRAAMRYVSSAIASSINTSVEIPGCSLGQYCSTAMPFQIVGVSQPGFEGGALQSRHDMQIPRWMTDLFVGMKSVQGAGPGCRSWAGLASGISLVPGGVRIAVGWQQLGAAKIAPGIGPGVNRDEWSRKSFKKVIAA
jgi:hypothetical protein